MKNHKSQGPIYGHYKIQQDYFNNPIRITNKKQMETKRKINWARIWQIIQAIITMILATETATRSL